MVIRIFILEKSYKILLRLSKETYTMKPKVFFVRNRLVDYINPWLNLVSQKIDLTVLLTRVNKKNYSNENVNFKCKPHSYFFFLGKFGLSLPVLFKLLTKDYDIVVSSDLHTFENPLSFLIAKLRGKKYVSWNETFEWPRSPRSKIFQPLIKIIAKKCDAAMTVGTKARDYLINLGTPRNKIFLTPYTTLKYPIKEFNLGLPEDKQIILYLSRMARYKGVDYLVKAFSKLEKERDDVFLLLCGEGPFTQGLQNLIQELGIKNYKFLNRRINPEEKGHIYSSSDIFVLPSTFRDYDADCWGLVINEAMSYSKPVISTDATGGAFDLIKQGINGYRIKQKDEKELYTKLKEILSNKELKIKMGAESQKIIDTEFNYDKMSQGFIDTIEFLNQ
jgi:glycosyltransferase involved in cell wall biosynthesis